MKVLPILFSTIMVQANLEDRKGMTRRTRGLDFINELFPEDWEYLGIDNLGHLMRNQWGATNAIKCPYGEPGDILWVRESYKNVAPFAKVKGDEMFVYKADDPAAYPGMKWKPSIHMQKRAARTWLQVMNVRIERLQNITEADAISEGIEKLPGSTNHTRFDYKHYKYGTYDVSAQVSFRTLWEIVNGTDSWGHNPWVWVIKYKILSKTGRPATFPEYVKEAV